MNFKNNLNMKSSILFLVVGNLVVLTVNGDQVDNEVDNMHNISERTSLGRCVSSNECGLNQCSVMGMQRFSEPHCAPLRGEGAACIVDAEPENRTLDFPDKTLECSDVYLLYCPCQAGLTCQQARCVRQQEQQVINQKEGPKRVPRLFPQWAGSARVQ